MSSVNFFRGNVRPLDSFFHMCLVVCPMLFLAGFVDSVAGGGGLISLPAYLFVGFPIHLASGTNKVVNSIGTGTAAWKYLRDGKVELSIAVWAAAGALAGGSLGARLALWCSEQVLQACVLAALPVAAAVMVLKRDMGQSKEEGRWNKRQKAVFSLLIGLCTGTYDGLIGPGTGTFMILAFTLVLRLDLLTASGCAKTANLASNIASALVWIAGGKVYWQLAVPAVICCVAGNWCGARYAIRGGSGKVRQMIFVVLGLLFLKMTWELLT